MLKLDFRYFILVARTSDTLLPWILSSNVALTFGEVSARVGNGD